MKNEELKKNKRYIAYRDNPRAVLTVPKAWCVRFGLTPTELMIFEEIHQATHFWALNCYCSSRTSLCVVVNGTPPTVDKALKKLVLKGFISKSKAPVRTKIGTERQNICYVSLLPKDVGSNASYIEDMLEKNIIRQKAIDRYPI